MSIPPESWIEAGFDTTALKCFRQMEQAGSILSGGVGFASLQTLLKHGRHSVIAHERRSTRRL
jgi:hypothetical protein